jgi:probable F420-dependent oxidoreductase
MAEPLILESSVRCGMVMPAQDRAQVLATARRIEAAGFDSIWVGDHISFHVPMVESLTLLSFIAAVTERVSLGTSVYLMPLRHPTTTAKVTAAVDVLSEGRLVLGVGVGGEFPPEFEACGVPVEERGSRTNEGIEILRRLWREDAVEHAGRHFRFGPVSLNPKPVRPGGPPILVGGRKTACFRRAGRLGDGYISYMCSTERYARNLAEIRKHAAEAGRKNVAFHSAAFLFTLFDDNYDAALDRASRTLEMTYQVPFREAARKYCLLGRPQDCLEQMRAFVRAGCRLFLLSPLMDPRELIEHAEKEILPELRSGSFAD